MSVELSTSTASASDLAGYARPEPRRRSRPHRGIIGLSLLGAAGVGLAMLAAWQGFPANLFGGGLADDVTLFEVSPTDMLITLNESGELKPLESIELRCEVEGGATILYIVPESTKVAKGDLLVELASDELKERLESESITLETTRAAYEAAKQELEITLSENASKLKKCEIDLEIAELDLWQYVEGEYEKLLATAEIDIAQAEQEIERKNEELEKNRKLFERQFVTQAKIDQLEFELEKAQWTLEKHKLTKKILQEYDRPKAEKQKKSTLVQAEQELLRERKRAESREAQARAKVAETERNLALRETRVKRLAELLTRTKIFAPVDGVVRYPSDGGWRGDDNFLTIGQRVFEGQTLVVLPNTSQMLVETRIHEADRHRLREGMPVEVRVPAVPGHVFPGRIDKIAKFADSANRWLNPNLKEHTTTILLSQTDAPLSPGDSADIRIFVDRIDGALAVPIQSVFARGNRSFVFVDRRGSAELVEVKLGQSNTSMIQVTDGLTAGDKVLLSVDERLLAMLPPATETGMEAELPPEITGGGRQGERREGNAPQRPGRGGRRAEAAGEKPAAAAASGAKPAEDVAAAEPATGSTSEPAKPEGGEAPAAKPAEEKKERPASGR